MTFLIFICSHFIQTLRQGRILRGKKGGGTTETPTPKQKLKIDINQIRGERKGHSRPFPETWNRVKKCNQSPGLSLMFTIDIAAI